MTKRVRNARRQRDSLSEFERLETRWALAASLSLNGPQGVIYEGERAEFTLTLSEPLRTAETVFVSTAPGTATYGVDYFAPPSTQLSFSPGQTRKTFSIATLRENRNPVEGVETFQVIVTPANRALGVRNATVRIDDFFTEPSVSISDAAAVEGNSGTTAVAFSVTLSAPSRRQVTVNYATRDGSATVADRDYAAANGTLTFAPGETTKTITVGVIGDTKFESRESYSVSLSAPTNAWLLKQNGYGYIDNDDATADLPGFQITVNPMGNLDPRVRTAVGQAVAKWQQVITGDVPSYVNPFNGQLVDDIVLDVRMGLLLTPGGTDGAGGTIANASPRYGITSDDIGSESIRPSPRLPYWGTIGFDPANVATASADELYYYSLHEIGHALGFGNPLFREKGLVVDQGTVPVYRGTNAVAAYNEIFQRNATTIPMDSSGVPGTGGVHWDGNAMRGELMVGSPELGGPTLSRITVGAMQDLGYQVRLAAADNYTPQPTNLVAAVAASSTTSTKPSTQAINSTLPRPVTTQPIVVTPVRPVTTTTTPRTPVKTTTPPRAPTQFAVSPISKATAFVRIVQR
jgi:hypothetical protein